MSSPRRPSPSPSPPRPPAPALQEIEKKCGGNNRKLRYPATSEGYTQLRADLQLIVDNALKYNPENPDGNPVRDAAVRFGQQAKQVCDALWAEAEREAAENAAMELANVKE